MNAVRGLVFAVTSTLLVLLAMTTVQAEPTPASSGVDWVNGHISVQKIEDFEEDGGYSIHGSLIPGFFYNGEYEVHAVEGGHKGSRQILPSRSLLWRHLDLDLDPNSDLGFPEDIHQNPGTNGAAFIYYSAGDISHYPHSHRGNSDRDSIVTNVLSDYPCSQQFNPEPEDRRRDQASWI